MIAPIAAEPTPYAPLGLRIRKKPALQNLPLFKSGAIEVQDEGSQVLAEQRIPLEMGDYLKMLPHKHDTDGFFAAVFERKAASAKPAPAESGDEAAE